MEEKGKLIQWIHKHKKALIIAGFSVVMLIGIVQGIKKREEIKSFFASLQKTIEKPVVKTVETTSIETLQPVEDTIVTVITQHRKPSPCDVSAHLRNLPKGRNASAEKIATASENGFVLAEGQTWVVNYKKGMAA